MVAPASGIPPIPGTAPPTKTFPRMDDTVGECNNFMDFNGGCCCPAITVVDKGTVAPTVGVVEDGVPVWWLTVLPLLSCSDE